MTIIDSVPKKLDALNTFYLLRTVCDPTGSCAPNLEAVYFVWSFKKTVSLRKKYETVLDFFAMTCHHFVGPLCVSVSDFR